jgi:predicted AAA+ superfamily ATPase
MAALPEHTDVFFYRTQAGAEVDLVIDMGPQGLFAVEIKRSTTPKVSKGFYMGCADLAATRRYVVSSGSRHFKLADGAEAIPLVNLLEKISGTALHG